MSNVAYLPIVGDRYGTLVRHLFVVGLDLTGVAMRAQVRLCGDTPGDPLVDLPTTTNGNAEGLRLVEVSTDGSGLPTSHVEIVVNETTMEGLPYAGELGDAVQFAWDMQITLAGRKRRLAKGEFEITGDGVTGADAAPANRPIGYGRARQPISSPWKAARLTFGEEQVTVQIVDADLVAPLAKKAGDAAISAADSRDKAALSAGAAQGTARYFTTRPAGEAASAVDQAFSTDDGAGNVIYYRRTAGGSTEIGRAVTPGALSAPTGFTLIKHKRGETGTYARTAAQLSKIGGFDAGDGTISVHHWIDPSLDDLIITRNNGTPLQAMIQAALDYAPIGATLGFLNGDYRVTDTLVQRRYLHFQGAYASRVQGLLGGTAKNLFEVRLEQSAYGLPGDARRLEYSGMIFYLPLGGASAMLMDVTGSGAIPNLYARFDRCAFDAANAVAARIKGLTTQGHEFSHCEFVNGLHFDSCADGSTVEQSVFIGDKGLILDMAGGAFQTHIVRNIIVVTGNALTVLNGAQVNFERNQVEMHAACTAAVKTHVLITPQSYVAKKIRITDNNFGAGTNIDYSIIAQATGQNIVDGLIVDGNTFNITASGVDIALNNAGVRWTRIGTNECRGNRGGVVIDPNGFAAANTADPKLLLSVTDNGTGTYGLTKSPGLSSGWAAVAGAAPIYRKTPDDVLHLTGAANGGAVGDVLFNLPAGFRPPFTTTKAVPCGGGLGSIRFDPNGDVVVQNMPAGPIELSVSIPVKGRASYDPGQ